MSKRTYGDGSVYQRKDGRWTAAISMGWRGTRRVRKTHYAHTKREALRWLRKTQRDIEDGIDPPDERLTVGALLARWLEDVQRNQRERTYRTYESSVRVHLAPGLGHKPLAKLRPADVADLITQKIAEGQSPQNVRNIHAVLRTALTFAVRLQLASRNVAAVIQTPEAGSFTPVVLSVADAQRLLDALRGERFEAVVVVGLSLGLRISEVFGLRWSDVDLERRRLSLGSQLQQIRGRGWVRGPLKAGEPRTLPLTDLAIAALAVQQQRQRDHRQAAPVWRIQEDLVFTMEDGRPLHRNTVHNDLHRILARLGLPKMRLHDLRHSCATLLIAQGVALNVVQEILGHARLATTADIYGHVLPSVSQDAADRLERALNASRDASRGVI